MTLDETYSAPLRRIGIDRITVAGVPRRWFIPYAVLSAALFFTNPSPVSGAISAVGVFLLCHISFSVLAALDPYALEIYARSLRWHRLLHP